MIRRVGTTAEREKSISHEPLTSPLAAVRKYRCGRCGEAGHYQPTCKARERERVVVLRPERRVIRLVDVAMSIPPVTDPTVVLRAHLSVLVTIRAEAARCLARIDAAIESADQAVEATLAAFDEKHRTA